MLRPVQHVGILLDKEALSIAGWIFSAGGPIGHQAPVTRLTTTVAKGWCL
jgi:hypothetical protein